MPKKLRRHSAVQIGGDLYVIGGYQGEHIGDQSAIYKLSCFSRVCKWTTMNQELKVARSWTIAIPIPKSFCVPFEKNNVISKGQLISKGLFGILNSSKSKQKNST